jgi:carbonic anhydrase
MKKNVFYKTLLILLLSFISQMALADEKPVKPYTAVICAEKQQEYTPQKILQRLKDGNQRFMNGAMKKRDLLMQAKSTADLQHPLAVV